MAFSSRFSFWEQKVKEEVRPPGSKISNQGSDSDSGSMSSRSQSVPSLEPSRGLLRTKSPEPAKTHPGVRVRSPSPPRVRGAVKVPERFKSLVPPIQAPAQHFRSPDPRRTSTISPEPVLNGNSKPNGSVNVSAVNGNSANGGARQPDLDNDDPSLTRKKVVKVVCQVVRKALPAEEEDAPAPEPTKPAPEPPKLVPSQAPTSVPKVPKVPLFSFKHDTIKTEEKDDISAGMASLMVRGRTRNRPRTRMDEPSEKEQEEAVKREKKEGPKLVDISNVGPVSKQEDKTPVSAVPAKVHPMASNLISVSSRSSPAGFIPAPKPSPLSPPAGFTPLPNSASLSPPAGFVPAPKSSPLCQPNGYVPAPKSATLSPPVGFVPAPKSATLSPPVGFVPAPKSATLSPPVGYVPAPKSTAISPSVSTAAPKSSPAIPTSCFIPPLKSAPLSPPAGFIPSPKSNAFTLSVSTAAPKSSPAIPTSCFIPPLKSAPLSPPAGFIPSSKYSPVTPPSASFPTSKSSPSTPPAGFVPVSKVSPLSPPPAFIIPKASALSPPPALIPPPKLPTVKKLEVVASPLSSVPIEKASPQNKSSTVSSKNTPTITQKEAPLSPTEEAQRLLDRIFSAPVKTHLRSLSLPIWTA